MSDDVLRMPCLGRPFQLGMLYDCRNEVLQPTVRLWEPDILTSATVSRHLPDSRYEINTNDSLDEKMSILGVGTNLKLSLMLGMIDLASPTNFLNDRRSSKTQARVTLHYESTSKIEELEMSLLKDAPHADIFTVGDATHFVAGIQYGTDAVAIFQRDVGMRESLADVESEMEMMVKSLPAIGLDNAGSADIPEMDREAAKKLKCTFYGNVDHPGKAISYEQAVLSYRELQQREQNSALDIPKRVWLHPLSMINPTVVRRAHMQETSVNLAAEVQQFLEDLHDINARTCELIGSPVCSKFLRMQNELSKFKQMNLEHKKSILKKFASLLPLVRRGEEEEKVLTNMLKAIASSPFQQHNLTSWISLKEKEVKLLAALVEFLRGIQIVSSPEELDDLVNSLEYDRVVCFNIMITNHEDQQLDQMNAFLRTSQWNQKQPEVLSWCENRDLTNDLKNQARNFRGFAQANEGNESTLFVITTVNSMKGDEVANVQLFQYGQPVDFKLPGKPGKPYPVCETTCSITLGWTKSPCGGTNVQRYMIHFRAASDTYKKWTKIQTNGPSCTLAVRGLNANATYLFKVNSECEAGLSALSDVSEPIETKKAAVNPVEGHTTQASGTFKDGKKEERELSDPTEYSSETIAATCETVASADRHPAGIVTSGRDDRNDLKKSFSSPGIHVMRQGSRPPRGREDTAGRKRNPNAAAFFVPYRPVEKILSRSKKIEGGLPSIYRLPMKVRMRRPNSMICKQSFGTPVPVTKGVTEKVLMVVGATGAGKSTLINGMVNYILGVEWEDNFRVKLVVDDASKSQANSQTKDITAYTFYPMNGSAIPYTFTIIDTPGFGDTEGLKRDRTITGQIKEFFSIPPPNGIDHLDGIGFVTQASLARLTPTQVYIFDSILSIFGNDVSNNIFMMLTFADGQHPPVLEAIKRANIPSRKFFKFNNSALFAKNEDTEESFDAMFWKMGFRSFKNFFADFEKTESVSLRLTKEVLKERDQLQTLIEGLNPQITMGLNKIEEMRQEELVLQHHEKEMETNKEFTYEVDVIKTRQIDLAGTGRHTTTCLRCNFTCHNNCAIADDRGKSGCVSMGRDGNCQVCTGKCHWSNHRNLPYLIEYETVSEMRTSEDLRKKYEKAITGKSRVEGMIIQLEEFLQDVHMRVLTMIHQAQQSVHRLDEIALGKPNPLTQVEYLELLVESEKQEAKHGWKQRVEYYEEAKRNALILSKVKDVKERQEILENESRRGQRWYHRFKFW